MATGSELTVAEYKERLKKHAPKLTVNMEYVYGLNDWLESLDVFTEVEMVSLKEFSKNLAKLNEEILKLLCQQMEEMKYKNFMEALKESLQSHLKQLILVDGNFDADELNQPLRDDQRKRLRSKQVTLVDIISKIYKGILDEMAKLGCISERHSRSVSEGQRSYDCARELLEIVRNRSLDHFRKFRECLHKLKSDAYELTDIENDGANVSAKIYTAATIKGNKEVSENEKPADKKDLSNAENVIAEKIPGATIKGTTVAAAEANKCIMLHFNCKTENSLVQFYDSVMDGSFIVELAALFNRLLGEQRNVTLFVKKVFPIDFSVQKFYLQCVSQKADISNVNTDHKLLRNGHPLMDRLFKSDPTLDNIKKSILRNAFKWRIADGRKMFSRPDLEAYETLSSVCRDWWILAEQDSFKEVIKTSRDLLKKKYESIKLKCEARITMDQEITCISSLMDETYIVIHESPNVFYLYNPNDPNRSAERSLEGIEAKLMESAVAESLAETTPSVGEQGAPTPKLKKEVANIKQANLEKIEVADGIEISSVVSVDDQAGLFCISRTDNSVWFWTKSEARNKATAFKQFSPCTNITVSPTAKGNLRIVVLKDKNAVEMHNPSSELIQPMFLPKHVKKVNDILCNKEGEMIVSYGSDDNPLHRITRLNRLGKPIRSYGNERGSGPNELNNPCSISLDQDDEILYVVDRGNERIVALDKNMNVINVVLDAKYGKKEKEIPTAVHYSKGSNRLQVVYKNAVEIFKINRKYRKTSGAVAPPAASPST